MVRVHKDSLRHLPPSAVASSRACGEGPAHRHPGRASRARAQQPRAARPRGRRLPRRGGRAGRPAPCSPPCAARARRPEQRPARHRAWVPVRSGALRRSLHSSGGWQPGRTAARSCARCASNRQQPLVPSCLCPSCLAQLSAACPGAGRPRHSLTCARSSAATLEAGGLPAAAPKARACNALRLINSGRFLL